MFVATVSDCLRAALATWQGFSCCQKRQGEGTSSRIQRGEWGRTQTKANARSLARLCLTALARVGFSWLKAMAISADVSDPIDDSRGGTFSWGKFQQDKAKIVYVFMDVPEGTRGKQIQVSSSKAKPEEKIAAWTSA